MALKLRHLFIVLLFWVIKPEQSYAAFSSSISKKENSKANVYSAKQAFKLQKLQYKFGVEPNDSIEVPKKKLLKNGVYFISLGCVMSFFVWPIGIIVIGMGLMSLVWYSRNKKMFVSESKVKKMEKNAKAAGKVGAIIGGIFGVILITLVVILFNKLGSK